MVRWSHVRTTTTPEGTHVLARSPQKLLLLAVGCAALIGAGVGAGTYAAVGGGSKNSNTVVTPTVNGSTSSSSPATLTSQQTPQSVGEIYKRDAPGVVEITVTTQTSGGGFFGQGGGTAQAQGSGWVYDSQGDIVTDQHVVDGASAISVKFPNGATYKATVVGTDASSDLALIKVSAPSSLLHPLTLGDSTSVAVGDGVVAIGSPFGLANSITSGIVSALHRDITAPNNFTITNTIQTDAAINHGNSGGVLLNLAGEVIGVTAQIDSESGGNDGVGFAIPSNTVRSVVSQLVGGGSVQRAYLGVHIQTIPSDAAGQLNVPAGVEITSVVSGSPAAKAGLKAAQASKIVNGQQYVTGGDVVTRVDGHDVTSADELQTLIADKKPGTKVILTLVRNGSTRSVTVTLGTRPS
jgi:S1-C subfamily serine protease